MGLGTVSLIGAALLTLSACLQPPRPDLVAKAMFANGMFIGQHGSWNRRPHSGYKVIFVPFVAGQASGPPVDVLTGFLSAEGTAYGRPVGVALDRKGALLVDAVSASSWTRRGCAQANACNVSELKKLLPLPSQEPTVEISQSMTVHCSGRLPKRLPKRMP